MNVVGFDTETYKGYVKVVTNSNGDFLESSDTLELLNFLFDKGNNDYNLFYNIEYDLGSIIKEYVVKNGDSLHKQFYERIKAVQIGVPNVEDESGYSFTIEQYHIVYLTGKMFSLRKGKITRFFWDASNFYKSGYGHMTLDMASKKYLNKTKNNKELHLDRAKIGSEPGYYENHRNDIIAYSIYDCVLTKELFERTLRSYENLGFVFPKKPYSEASIFKEYLKPKWDKEIDYGQSYLYSSYSQYFRNSYRGGLFQTWKIGRYYDVYDIDINSAYPYVLSKLPSIVNSKIVLNEKGDYTFYKIRCSPNKFLPIKIDLRLVYGISKEKFTFFITEWDKKILDLYGYPYEIIDYIGIRTKGKLVLPDLQKIYEKKKEIKKQYGENSVEYMNIKIALNSGYGVFAQSYPQFTKFTNFIYASYATSETRYIIAKMAKELTDLGDEVISISTDGILLKQKGKHDIGQYFKKYQGDEMGKWKLDYFDNVVQYANGIYVLTDDKGKYILRKRGFETMKIDDLKTDRREIAYESYKPMKIISGIIQRKYKEINDFSKQTKVFSPYVSWINVNPELAESIFEWSLNDFRNKQLDVPLLDIDKYPYLIQKVIDNEEKTR